MRYLALLALCTAALPAYAAPWVIAPSSTLTFTGKQAGEAFTGQFTKFTPVVDFDPAKPQDGKISVTVDIASATIDDKDKQDSLPTKDWFFTEQFPSATFTSTSIKATSSKSFEATGTLTLRGVTKPVTVPFTLRETEGTTHAEGQIKLMRNDFQVGQGQWKDDQWIAFPVEVDFHLRATQPKE